MLYLTSLRGLAALLVVFFHIKHYMQSFSDQPWFWFVNNGFLAVDFFFLLSGFILAYTYHTRLAEFSVQKFFAFMAMRFARIYPLHLFVLLLFLLVPFAHWITGREMPQEGFGTFSFFAKLFLVDTWWTGHFETWNVPSWSISAEWMAYLLFPAFLFLGQKVRPWALSVAMVFLATLTALIFSKSGEVSIGQDIDNMGVIRCLLEFCMGILVFRFSTAYRIHAVFGYGLLMGSLVLFYLGVNFDWRDYYFAPICFACLLLGLISTKGFLHNLLSTRPLVYLGEISYSIYMVHYWILYMMTMLLLETGETPGVFWIAGYTLATIVFSAFSYKLVEVPCRRRITKRFQLGL